MFSTSTWTSLLLLPWKQFSPSLRRHLWWRVSFTDAHPEWRLACRRQRKHLYLHWNVTGTWSPVIYYSRASGPASSPSKATYFTVVGLNPVFWLLMMAESDTRSPSVQTGWTAQRKDLSRSLWSGFKQGSLLMGPWTDHNFVLIDSSTDQRYESLHSCTDRNLSDRWPHGGTVYYRLLLHTLKGLTAPPAGANKAIIISSRSTLPPPIISLTAAHTGAVAGCFPVRSSLFVYLALCVCVCVHQVK